MVDRTGRCSWNHRPPDRACPYKGGQVNAPKKTELLNGVSLLFNITSRSVAPEAEVLVKPLTLPVIPSLEPVVLHLKSMLGNSPSMSIFNTREVIFINPPPPWHDYQRIEAASDSRLHRWSSQHPNLICYRARAKAPLEPPLIIAIIGTFKSLISMRHGQFRLLLFSTNTRISTAIDKGHNWRPLLLVEGGAKLIAFWMGLPKITF